METSKTPSSQTHIVQIIPTLRHGGAERLVVSLSNGLVRQGYRVSLVVFFDDLPLTSQLDPSIALHVVQKNDRWLGRFLAELRRTLISLNPDIVHTHLFGADVWARWVAHRLDIPVVMTEHNINTAEGRVKHALKRWVSTSRDTYVAVSQGVVDYMKRVYGIQNNIHVISPGIDTALFARIPTASYTEPYRILMIGRLETQKGFDRGLMALAQVTERSWQCHVVGSGSQEQMLTSLAKKHGIADRVTFVPATDDVVSVYSSADIVLMPSRWEGFGMVALEAMAAGRVVIGTRVGGLTGMIDDKKTGMLTDGSPDAIAAAVTWVFDHPAEATDIAVNAKKKARAYDVSQMVDQYVGLYQSIV